MALLLHYLVVKLSRWWLVAWVDYFNHLTLSVTSGHSAQGDERSTVQGFEM